MGSARYPKNRKSKTCTERSRSVPQGSRWRSLCLRHALAFVEKYPKSKIRRVKGQKSRFFSLNKKKPLAHCVRVSVPKESRSDEMNFWAMLAERHEVRSSTPEQYLISIRWVMGWATNRQVPNVFTNNICFGSS